MEITRTGQFILSQDGCRSDDIRKGLSRQEDLRAQGRYQPLGQILVDFGSLSPERLNQALEEQCLEVLGKSEIFRGLSREILHKVIVETPLRTYPAGAVLMRQDEPGESFYLLVSGKTKAFRVTSAGIEIPLAEFGPGQGFGEISVLARRPRTAFVQTIQPSSLLVFSEGDFLRICRECPDLSLALIRMLCQRLVEGNLALDRISDEELSVRQLFGRFVAPEVRDEILSGKISLDGEIRTVTLLFSDLRDFTPMTESTPPKTMVSILNAYFTEMTQAIRSEQGVVLQYVGDEVEAVFGAPMPLSDHSDRAVRAALKMRKRLVSLNDRLKRAEVGTLRHGIGIHTGEVVAANIGSPDRKSYALVGSTVNLASRVQNANKALSTDILITSATLEGLRGVLFSQDPAACFSERGGRTGAVDGGDMNRNRGVSRPVQDLREKLDNWVKAHGAASGFGGLWRNPLLVSARADARFDRLPEITGFDHLLPRELMPSAKSVVIFFIPFAPSMQQENVPGKFPCRKWGVAYEKTNALIERLCAQIIGFLKDRGFDSTPTPATHNFDPVRLKARWSHKHLGHLAGLGRFGVNCQLITPSGCAGRLGSLVTEADLGDHPLVEKQELCLHKTGEKCLECLRRCPVKALTPEGILRQRCFSRLKLNLHHTQALAGLGESTHVCGKCVVGLPCSVDPADQTGCLSRKSERASS